ncbi:LysR family transcriptional regulator [Shewanella sp. NFH-SH190041]|uniref:LysR family transcriptional regulator n=1 Tax=Shewanella sp. NFH-SH190041 TaxID=2950245 RepID=UPI0021C3C42B|nr:LysR family transcriptional regulator [Shewanella sp. NFH-SH190041]
MTCLPLLEQFLHLCRSASQASGPVNLAALPDSSAAAQTMAELSQRLGQPIIQSDTPLWQLTDAGKALYCYAAVMQRYSGNKQAQENGSDKVHWNTERHTLRLGVPTDYISRYLNTGLLQFIREFTPMKLVIDTDVSGNLFKRLKQGTFDMIIATHWQAQPDGDKLFERRFHWVAAANSQLLQSPVLPIALYPENCPIRAQVFANHSINQPPLNIVLSSPSPLALCEAVTQDIAIAPVAAFRITDAMQILNPAQFGLPQLPVFNEAVYLTDIDNKQTATPRYAALKLLRDLFKANSQLLGEQCPLMD